MDTEPPQAGSRDRSLPANEGQTHQSPPHSQRTLQCEEASPQIVKLLIKRNQDRKKHYPASHAGNMTVSHTLPAVELVAVSKLALSIGKSRPRTQNCDAWTWEVPDLTFRYTVRGVTLGGATQVAS